MKNSSIAIKTTDLTRIFGKRKAVDSLNIEIRQGEIFSLIGTNGAGNIAGFCTFCFAWFPTTKTIPLDLSGYFHFIAASIFFLDLAGFSLFLVTREREKSTKQKLKRNKIYIISGLVIIVCLIAMTMYFSFLQESYLKSRFVYWCETSALVAFGVSWLTKGGTLYPDKLH
jgi:hypothetical protein